MNHVWSYEREIIYHKNYIAGRSGRSDEPRLHIVALAWFLSAAEYCCPTDLIIPSIFWNNSSAFCE